jgi:hypothetical protein
MTSLPCSSAVVGNMPPAPVTATEAEARPPYCARGMSSARWASTKRRCIAGSAMPLKAAIGVKLIDLGEGRVGG